MDQHQQQQPSSNRMHLLAMGPLSHLAAWLLFLSSNGVPHLSLQTTVNNSNAVLPLNSSALLLNSNEALHLKPLAQLNNRFTATMRTVPLLLSRIPI
jgi:hypothetical protein